MLRVKIDPDELVDATEAAAILGLTNPKGVHVYRRRYADAGFPAPVVDKGRCVLWRRHDILKWHTTRTN